MILTVIFVQWKVGTWMLDLCNDPRDRALDPWYKQPIPPALAALRPDAKLYREALGVYYRFSSFRVVDLDLMTRKCLLNERWEPKFMDLRPEIFSYLTTLNVIFE